MSDNATEVLKWPREEAKEPDILEGLGVVPLKEGEEVGVEGAGLTFDPGAGRTSPCPISSLPVADRTSTLAPSTLERRDDSTGSCQNETAALDRARQ